MAARTMRLKNNETTIERIRASALVNRLVSHVLATPSDRDSIKKYMTASQVTAALGLLKKVIPDLANVQVSGDEDQPLVHEIRRTIVDPRPEPLDVTSKGERLN